MIAYWILSWKPHDPLSYWNNNVPVMSRSMKIAYWLRINYTNCELWRTVMYYIWGWNRCLKPLTRIVQPSSMPSTYHPGKGKNTFHINNLTTKVSDCNHTGNLSPVVSVPDKLIGFRENIIFSLILISQALTPLTRQGLAQSLRTMSYTNGNGFASIRKVFHA